MSANRKTLAQALHLPRQARLTLRRTAAGDSTAKAGGPGKPIGDWDPHALEVHPAGTGPIATGASRKQALSGYVPRAHDQVLADAVREAAEGLSRMLFLVGSSSTGKTRACWEAVQPLAAQGWRLWHPFDPTRAESALAALHQVAPRTVVWLNEAQHYLDDEQIGERIAAALHSLLNDLDRGPVLVLGTLWEGFSEKYLALPLPGRPDPHSQVRAVLSGRLLSIPDTFDEEALAAAAALALDGDALLEDALGRASVHGRLAQDLAGAPELLRRYNSGSPAVRALLQAAMDARRLGVGLHLPQSFLTDAALDYLNAHDYDLLDEGWAKAAYEDLVKHVHGKQAPLSRPKARLSHAPAPVAGPVFRLADYLEQHGRSTRRHLYPPASFWEAARTHVSRAEDLTALAAAARSRHRPGPDHPPWRVTGRRLSVKVTAGADLEHSMGCTWLTGETGSTAGRLPRA